MNKQDKLQLLQQWKDAYDRNELATQTLRELIGDIPRDSVIYKAMWDTFDYVTDLTVKILGGGSEDLLVLKWFEIDCGMGVHPRMIDGTMVDSVDVLVNFI